MNSPMTAPSSPAAASADLIPARAFRARASHPAFRAFAAPTGWLGRLAGWIMTRKNLPLNRLAVQTMEARAGEHVLEIGFGPGCALALLSAAVGPDGLVAGVDRSPEMLAAATRRNRPAVHGGRMRLTTGTADQLAWPEASFDRVLSVSNVQFWQPATRSLAEILRVLKPRGRLVIAVHTLREGQRRLTPGLFADELVAVKRWIERNGFVLTGEVVLDQGITGLCLVAQRPA